MFDPHRIGPRRSSSYARNKGRVIQRRLVDTPSPGYTRTELEELVPLMRKNGFIPEPTPPPSPDFGRMISYSVVVDGTDISNIYREITPEELEGQYVTIESRGVYMLVVPNFDGNSSVYPAIVFNNFRAEDTGQFIFVGMQPGTRLYSMGDQYDVDTLTIVGENGTYVTLYLDSPWGVSSTETAYSASQGGICLRM